MADEATVVNENVEQVTTTEESTTPETKELEVIREGEPVEPILHEQSETEGEAEAEETKEQSEESTEEAQAEETDEKPLGEKGQKRMQTLANQVREQREYIKQLESQLVPEVEPYDVNKAIAEGVPEERAKLEAIESRLDAQEQQKRASEETNRLIELNNAVLTDAENVIRDFPELDESSPEYDPVVTKTVMDMWHQAADVQYMTDSKGQVVTDTNGQPLVTNARLSLYDFVNNINSIGSAKQTKGAVEGQKAAEKNLAAVEVRPSAKPKQTNTDDSKLSADEYAKKYGLSVAR